MNTSRKRPAGRNPEWATVHGRVRWLVKTRFGGNRSAMAKAIGFSHTVVANVVNGKAPGRRLLDAIATRLSVDPAWLRDGEGQPFLSGAEADTGRGLPVTNVLLPGPPLDHQALITGDWVDVPEVVPSPTTYWLALKSSQPIVKVPSSGFHTGDHLLMETDPAKFTRETDLRDHLCVVRAGAVGGELRLAIVTYYPSSMDDGPARLEAEFPEPVQSDQDVVERVYRHVSGGVVRYHERRLGQTEARHSEPTLPRIRYTDIVSVWLKILHRPV